MLLHLATALLLSGTVTITDGDTLRLGDHRIRLHGIDAPEMAQRCQDADGKRYLCGVEAKRQLEALIAGRPVSCQERGRDRYRRSVAVCAVSGVDLGEWLVRNGWALAYRDFSLDYVAAEDAARQEGIGLWAGSFESPAEWRKANR